MPLFLFFWESVFYFKCLHLKGKRAAWVIDGVVDMSHVCSRLVPSYRDQPMKGKQRNASYLQHLPYLPMCVSVDIYGGNHRQAAAWQFTPKIIGTAEQLRAAVDSLRSGDKPTKRWRNSVIRTIYRSSETRDENCTMLCRDGEKTAGEETEQKSRSESLLLQRAIVTEAALVQFVFVVPVCHWSVGIKGKNN